MPAGKARKLGGVGSGRPLQITVKIGSMQPWVMERTPAPSAARALELNRCLHYAFVIYRIAVTSGYVTATQRSDLLLAISHRAERLLRIHRGGDEGRKREARDRLLNALQALIGMTEHPGRRPTPDDLAAFTPQPVRDDSTRVIVHQFLRRSGYELPRLERQLAEDEPLTPIDLDSIQLLTRLPPSELAPKSVGPDPGLADLIAACAPIWHEITNRTWKRYGAGFDAGKRHPFGIWLQGTLHAAGLPRPTMSRIGKITG